MVSFGVSPPNRLVAPAGDYTAPNFHHFRYSTISNRGSVKSAVSRRFVALSAEWMAADLSQLDLLAIQIDGMHITAELTLLAAIGIDGEGAKHPLGLLEGATENAAVMAGTVGQPDPRGSWIGWGMILIQYPEHAISYKVIFSTSSSVTLLLRGS